MRHVFIALLLITGCTTKQSDQSQPVESTFQLTDLEGEWQMLTEMDNGEQVIFYPCDADNLSIMAYGDTLVIGWGQDASMALIKSFYSDDDKIVLVVNDLEGGQESTFFFQFENESGTLARWWLYGDDSSNVYVHEDDAEQFSSYEQPCEECWDDCDDV
jgi:hypothetical protein